MIHRKTLETLDFDLNRIEKEHKKIAVIIPITVEILFRYFQNIYFVSYSKKTNRDLWDFDNKETNPIRKFIRKNSRAKKLKILNKQTIYRRFPKDKKILTKLSISGEFNFGNGTFISIKDETQIEKQIQDVLHGIEGMPLMFPDKEILKVDYDGYYLSWINPSIEKEELPKFTKELKSKITDAVDDDEYLPYKYINMDKEFKK